jgi:hypothetical protein
MFDNHSVDAYLGHPMFDSVIDGSQSSKAGARGHFYVEHYRPNEFGELLLLQILEIDNGITTVGLNYLLGGGFHSDTQITGWYLFPIDNTSYSALSSADTMGSHAGWIESAAYSESTRPSWGPGAASAGSILNSTPVVMTVNADSTALVGMGVTSVATKSGTTGTLWATGLFGAVQNMNSGDVLKITYTVTLTATS